MGAAGILQGMRIVEGSAFVAMPFGGMTLAQMGADVIRFDPIGGGLDYTRWPVDARRQPQPVLGRPEQGQAVAGRRLPPSRGAGADAHG